MAGDWIKMRADLFTHPKIVRMSSALKADTLRTVGGLMSVWCLFDAHSVDGKLEGYTPSAIDNHLRWPGFSSAMIGVNWMAENPEGLELPRFECHNGQSAKRRAQDADRKKEVRKTSAPEADKNRTREEKRREEKSNSTTGELTFDEFLKKCLEKGEKPIPENDSVYAWAEKVNMPDSVLIVTWQAFKRREWKDAKGKPKKYKDWRKAFRTYCENPDWLGVFSINRDGEYYLTAAGKLLEREANWSAS